MFLSHSSLLKQSLGCFIHRTAAIIVLFPFNTFVYKLASVAVWIAAILLHETQWHCETTEDQMLQIWLLCTCSSHANTCCVLCLSGLCSLLIRVALKVLTESIVWWLTIRKNFYQPVLLVQVFCDCAIMEAWLPFHDITAV